MLIFASDQPERIRNVIIEGIDVSIGGSVDDAYHGILFFTQMIFFNFDKQTFNIIIIEAELISYRIFNAVFL